MWDCTYAKEEAARVPGKDKAVRRQLLAGKDLRSKQPQEKSTLTVPES